MWRGCNFSSPRLVDDDAGLGRATSGWGWFVTFDGTPDGIPHILEYLQHRHPPRIASDPVSSALIACSLFPSSTSTRNGSMLCNSQSRLVSLPALMDRNRWSRGPPRAPLARSRGEGRVRNQLHRGWFHTSRMPHKCDRAAYTAGDLFSFGGGNVAWQALLE